jgi:hypothetical protein
MKAGGEKKKRESHTKVLLITKETGQEVGAVYCAHTFTVPFYLLFRLLLCVLQSHVPR